jgi:asparaginyl-tRNA synthetase
MKSTEIKQVFKTAKVGDKFTVNGFVRGSSEGKTVAFLKLNDGSTLKHLQIVVGKEVPENTDIKNITKLIAGDDLKEIIKTKKIEVSDLLPLSTSMQIEGEIAANEKADGGIELVAKSITLIGLSPADEFPIQKKGGASLEFLRTIPHLRVRTNTFNAMFRVRSVLSFAIHKFFQQNGFIYAHTPIIANADGEGAGEAFKITNQSFEDIKKRKNEADFYKNDFFGTEATLCVTGQMEGEVMAMSHGKIYTFGPTFRAENSNTPRHAAEFWMIEPEVAFMKLEGLLDLEEEFIKFVVDDVLKTCPDEIAFFNQHYKKTLLDELNAIVKTPFKRISYTEAVDILIKSKKKFENKVEWGIDLAKEHENFISDEVVKGPVFITNYPKDIKAFYMKQNADGKTVAAADLLVPYVGEVCGGSEREINLEKLTTEMKNRKMKIEEYKNYLDLRKFGTAPHSGFGLGLERLLMLLTGMQNIRDVQIFSRSAGELR